MTSLNIRAVHELDGDRAKLKWQGACGGTAAANTTTTFDFTVPEERWLEGCEYVLAGGTLGDHVTLQVVHPTAGVLDEFGTTIYVKPDEHVTYLSTYLALLPAGLIIRFKYTNTHATAAAYVYFNVKTHIPRM